MNLKTCTQCRGHMPATTDCFYAQKLGKGGLMASCKECNRAAIARNVQKRMADDSESFRQIRNEAARKN